MTPHRPARWPRVATHGGLLAVSAALGFALSTSPEQADALGLPTIPLPGLTTVTLPGLPTTTTAAATGATPTTTTTDSQAAPPTQPGQPTQTAPTATTAGAPETPAANTTVAGAIRLAGGVVSIPISSVRAPARLRILLSVAPKKIARVAQPVSVRARIVDTRGYVVRGAQVIVKTGPGGALRTAGKRVSKVDGLTGFVVRNRVALRRGARLVLFVRAVDPAAPKAATASRRVQIAVRRP